MTIYEMDGWAPTLSAGFGALLPGAVYQPPVAGSVNPITVELLSNTLVRQMPIPFVSLTATLYYNAVGAWSVLAPYSDALWNQVMSGEFIINIDWQGLFSIGGKCEAPGYVDSIPGSAGGSGPYAGPFITLAGADYLALIANRIVYPTPSAAWASQTAGGADAVSAMKLETAIKHYVNNNVGPGALSTRRNTLLGLATDQARGPAVSYTAKFGSGVDLNLLDVVRALIAQGNTPMGISITRNVAAHNLTFDVYVPRDLSGKAWFSEQLGNLTAINFAINDPTCTDALVQGSGTSFVSRSATATTQWNKAEQFIDSTSETDANNLATTAQQAIAAGGRGPIMSATMTDIPFLTYGRDYHLGDIVSVEVRPGAVYSDVVSSVTLTADPAQNPQISVVPSVGNSAIATATDQSVVGQLTARIQALEKKLATK